MNEQHELLLIVYAPALADNDGRPLAVVRGMERALPSVRLGWTVSREGGLIALPRRDTWLAEQTKDGGFPLVCNGDERHPVMVYGTETPARQAPGGQPLLGVHAQLPLDKAIIAVASEVLECVAEGARAFWGHATPDGAALHIARQTSDPVRKPQPPPLGLPALKLPEDIRSPEIPHRLGWLNYWSTDAARAIGFPDPSRDADLLSRSRRTASGGWLVQLTESPLDLELPSHLDALLRAHERFPELGGRSPR
jgi:hypothetical protein